jgi:predicted permease
MESDMDAELRAHMEAHADHLIATGVPPAEAIRRAQLDFGSLAHTKEACREERGANLLPSLLQDLSFGVRMLRKSPGFTALAILTLALGIGSTTAVFSVVHGVLLRALPYRNPGRLVYVFEPVPRVTNVPLYAWDPFNADFYDWQSQNKSFDHLAAFSFDSINLSVNGAARRVNNSRVTGEFFQTLGISPQIGRVVGPDDDQPGSQFVAVISNALWQSQFGSDPHVLGKELLLNAASYRVIGVMPPSFRFPHGAETFASGTEGKNTDVWTPLALSPKEKEARDDGPGTAIGLLKPGVPTERAQAELRALTARFDSLRPPFFQGATVVVRPFDEAIAGDSRRALLIFMAAVFLVLLIASSNIASLVLARMHGRSREFSLRTALGASRGRLLRQLSVESLCIAGAGGTLGILAATATVRLLIHFHPTELPRLDEISIDLPVLLFALAASLATVVLCGIFPAWSVSRADLNAVLKSAGSRSIARSLGRLDRGLMVGQVALTFVLLAGSGLLIRSFVNLQKVDKGFQTSSTISTSIRLDERYDDLKHRIAFDQNLVTRVSAIPGVETVAAANHLPLAGGQSLSTIEVEGHPFEEKMFFEDREVSPNYFSTLGIPLVEGRDFTNADADGQTPVTIISRSFARKYFPGQSALGKKLKGNGERKIIGVVGDVRQLSLETTPPLQFYTPIWQSSDWTWFMQIVARTSLPPTRFAADMRALVHSLDPAVAVADVRTGDDLMSAATAERRFETFLLTAFGGMALFLSLVGLYALMTYSVEQRTGEIGIRMALGAQPGSVLRLVLEEGSRLALAGIALGFIGAWFAAQSMASLLFEVKPTDLPTFLEIAALFCLVALAACYLPARRATRVDPLVSLRAG